MNVILFLFLIYLFLFFIYVGIYLFVFVMLFLKRVFADIIKDSEMGSLSSVIRASPDSKTGGKTQTEQKVQVEAESGDT